MRGCKRKQEKKKKENLEEMEKMGDSKDEARPLRQEEDMTVFII